MKTNNQTITEAYQLKAELARLQNMEYYRYHSFLNGIERIYNKYENRVNEEEGQVILSFVKEAIRNFVDVYGSKNISDQVRESAQDLIISRDWNFN